MIIYGADTETLEGPPLTFQFWSKDHKQFIVWTNTKNSTRDFFKCLTRITRGHAGELIVVYVHNLTFDLVSFFYDRLEKFKQDEFAFKAYGWEVTGIYADVVFATFRKGDYKVQFVDSYAYFKTSLAKLAAFFCPDLPKLKRPNDLGQKRFKPDDQVFINYAMRDAEIAWYIGRFLQDMHRDYAIRQTVSAPQMAARIFQRRYLKRMLPQPPRKVVYAAMHSYHGGRNNLTVEPGWYKDITVIDITSAYPDAIRNMPSFSDERLYKTLEGHGRIDQVPPWGVYKIQGEVAECRWPCLYTHDFKPMVGPVDKTWVTGFELNESLRMGEIELDWLTGYYYEADKDKHESPFVAYVDEFFRLKDAAQAKHMRLFYKILLNSLYGKFIQTKGVSPTILLMEDEDDYYIKSRHLQAGGLFHPFIASMITGQVRATLHQLEHQYQSLHTATDSVMTTQKPRRLPKGLGGLTVEARGDLCVARNKLYIIYSDTDPDGSALASQVYKGKYIVKYAKHGFHGNIHQLEYLLATGRRTYQYTKVNKLKESLRRGLTVNKFEPRCATITIK